MPCFWCLESLCCNVRINCLDGVCLWVDVLGKCWKIPFLSPFVFSFFFSFVLTKTRKEFLRTSKPNVAMQHSWEFVLEAHILNIKLTTDLQERQKTFRTRKKERVSKKEKSINVRFFWCCFPRGQNRIKGPGNWVHFRQSGAWKICFWPVSHLMH